MQTISVVHIIVIIVAGCMLANAQIDTSGGEIAKSLNTANAELESESMLAWSRTLILFEEMNSLWTEVSQNASRLYIPGDQPDVLNMLRQPDCLVRISDQHRFNGTSTHEFMCCHRRRFAPLRRIVHIATEKLTDSITDSFGTSPEKVLLGIGEMIKNDMQGYVWRGCKDDISFHTPQQNIVRSIGYNMVAGEITALYEFVKISISSLLACIYDTPLPPYCISDVPLQIGNMSIPSLLYESNPNFAIFCSQEKLEAFEVFRIEGDCTEEDWAKALVGPTSL